MNWFARYASGLLTVLLLTGLISVPGRAQHDSSNQQAVNVLKSAVKKTLEAGSYTKEIDLNFEQHILSVTIKLKTNSSVTFEHPYLFIKSVTEAGNKGDKEKRTRTLEFLGKQDQNYEFIELYLRSEGPGGWTKINSNQLRDYIIGYNWFRDPETLLKQLKNVQVEGEETINGHVCRKISAEQKATFIEETAKEKLKATAGRAKRTKLQNMDLSVDVKQSDIDIWVRKDSSYLEKISGQMEQTVRMTTNARDNKRSPDIAQDLQIEVTFTNYESTSVPQLYKDELEQITLDTLLNIAIICSVIISAFIAGIILIQKSMAIT